MGEGFPLWSLVSMAWEGREPLRDSICLSVSLYFYVPDSSLSPFLIFPEILYSDWAEILTWFVSGYWLYRGERRAPTALRGGHEGLGHAWPPTHPCLIAPSGILSRWFFFPKFINIPKKISVNFYPIWTLFDMDFLWNKKHATNKNWHWALDQYVSPKNSIKSCQKYMKVV